MPSPLRRKTHALARLRQSPGRAQARWQEVAGAGRALASRAQDRFIESRERLVVAGTAVAVAGATVLSGAALGAADAAFAPAPPAVTAVEAPRVTDLQLEKQAEAKERLAALEAERAAAAA